MTRRASAAEADQVAVGSADAKRTRAGSIGQIAGPARR